MTTTSRYPAGTTCERFVGGVLAPLHEKPAEPWTLEALGRQVRPSRSALQERFVDFVGQPPMQQLTQWRMQLASGLLRSTSANVASIALEVGHDSEAAFARAFKRLAGSRARSRPEGLPRQAGVRGVCALGRSQRYRSARRLESARFSGQRGDWGFETGSSGVPMQPRICAFATARTLGRTMLDANPGAPDSRAEQRRKR
jgi:AraC-like DNA-binding protein